MSRAQGHGVTAESGWAPLSKGALTGVDWSAAEATECVDPYLVWAETDRFEGYRLGEGRASQPQWLPIVIELHPGYRVQDLLLVSDTKWLQVPQAYLSLPALRFCTARVRKGFFKALRKHSVLADTIRRYELGLPVEDHTGALHAAATPRDHAPMCSNLLRGKVMGVIDGGLALANTAFLRPDGTPRVRYFWRQDEFDGPSGSGAGRRLRQRLTSARSGPLPADLGYGHELTGEAIHDAMRRFSTNGAVNEEDLYDHLQHWDLKHPTHHGTLVASLAAGPWVGTAHMSDTGDGPNLQAANDEASQCELIAVQLDWANVVDTSGGAMNVSVLDALMYMLNRVADDASLVVNISWGTLAGPHDGTSVLEAAIDQLITLRGPERLQVFVPAGNGYQDRTHANQCLEPGQSLELYWHVQPDDRSQSFMELWLGDPQRPEDALHDVSIDVTLPGGKRLGPLQAGQSGCWPSANKPCAALVFPRRSALGQHGTCALLALCPTAALEAADRLAPAGVWTVHIRNLGLKRVVVDAFIERDDIALGTHTGARQSYLLDEHLDIGGNPSSFSDVPDNPTPIRRSGIFNSMGTGKATVSVGGERFAGSAVETTARYSPKKPDPDASRQPQRAHTTRVPDEMAFTDESAALLGVLGAGVHSASVVRLSGTSCASPQAARKRFNAMDSSPTHRPFLP